MLVELTLTEALEALRAPRVLYCVERVPGSTPAPSHCLYRPEYAWLFVWEREIARVIEPWIGRWRHRLLGTGGLISEALSNAYGHGHRRDPTLPIEATVWLGARGLLLRVKDRGDGFEWRSKRQSLQRGQRYFEYAGSGLRSMEACEVFQVFYGEGGTAFHLLHLFAPA